MSDPQDPIVRPPKAPPPELSTRAPRPRPVRVRRDAVIAITLGASALFGGAMAWAFIVAPQLRQAGPAKPPPKREAEGAARPSEIITRQPATYAQASLPPPRRFGEHGAAEPPPVMSPPPAPLRTDPTPGAPRPIAPTLVAQARQSRLTFPDLERPVFAAAPSLAPSALPHATGPSASATRLSGPASPFELKAGALIPALMLTALDTSRPGAVVAVTTEAVYDTMSGKILLIPPGSRLLGRQDGASKYGDRRAFLVWERLILPNGKNLLFSSEPAVDAQGAHGAPGRADRRIAALLRASLFAGAITALGQAARDRDDDSGGWLGDAGDAAAIQAAQIGGRLIGRELDVAPSIRLAAGAPVQVLLTHDLVLEPYLP